MTTKHTPAPWLFDYEKHGKRSQIRQWLNKSDLCEPVCIIPHDDITEDGVQEMLANARLIAAAPMMYEALIAIVDAGYLDDGYAPTLAMAKAAIAKAEGK